MNPDGDAVASSIGLARILQSMGKRAAVKCCDDFPEKFNFLYQDYKDDLLTNPIFVGVDISEIARLGALANNNVTVCIDYHASNDCLIEKTYLESDAVSCSLIIYKIFRHMGIHIPKDALSLLFAGIVTDSICFQSAATNAEAFSIAGEIAKEIDTHAIIQRVFMSKTKAELEVEQSLLASFTYYYSGQLVIGILPYDKISLIGKKNSSGFSSLVLKPVGVRIGVAILEREPNKYSISFKSSEFDMTRLAEPLGGGGHTEAAGVTLKANDLNALFTMQANCYKYNKEIIMNSEHRARQFREDLYFCSNFYPLPMGIEYKGLIYPTAENAYQAQKVPEDLREPFVTMTAKEAKDAGAMIDASEDWENQKLTIMYDIVRLKFRIPELAEQLINTEPERLIEYNDWGDTFWGVDSETDVGENHLGKILKRVRQELMEQQST